MAFSTKDTAMPGSRRPTAPDFRKKIDESREKRRQDVTMWDWTHKMLKGDQNIVFDGKRIQFISALQTQPGRNQSVTNQLLPPYRTVMGILKTKQPKVQFVGASPSWDNIAKSLACQQAYSYWWQQQKMARKLRKASRYLCTSGTAALHTWFDTAAQEVATEVLSAYDLLFEANCLTFEESDWRACRHVYTRASLQEAYPKHASYLAELAPLTNRNNVEKVPEDRLDVWDVYWNDGTHRIICGERWLYEGKTPGNLMPLLPFRYTEIPNQLWGMPMLLPLLDPQRQYNRYKNMYLDIADAHSAPTWMASYAAGVNKAMFNNEPNNVVFYRQAGGAPVRVPPPAVPEHLFQINNRVLGEMSDLAGIHASTNGKRTVGVTSGKAMEQLESGDMRQLEDTMEAIADAVVDTTKVVLAFWQAYMTEVKAVRYFDEGIGSVVFHELRNTDLLECPEVFMQPGTLFMQDAEARDAMLKELAAAGWIDAATLLEQLSFRIGNKAGMDKMMAISHAKDLLEWCKRGGEIEIFPTDDLKTIREVFIEYMHTPQYYEKLTRAHLAMQMSGDAPLAVYAYQKAMDDADYIRDVVAAIDTFGGPPGAYEQQKSQQVWPVRPQQPLAGGQPQMQSQQPMPPQMQSQMPQQRPSRGIAGTYADARVNKQHDAIKGQPGVAGAHG